MTVVGVPLGMLWDGVTPEVVREALNGRAVRARLREELTSMLAGDAVLSSCRIRRAKFKPGRKATTHIDVRVRSDVDEATRQVVMRLRPDGDLPTGNDTAVADLSPAPDAPGVAITRPFERLHGHIRELNAEVLVSPFDPQLPMLHQLADPTYVGRMLASECASDRCPAVGIHPVRYRPGERHVLEYVPLEPTAGGIGTVFAKLSRNGDPARIGAITARAADVLEASDPRMSAARPVHGGADANVLLLAGAGGRPLSELLTRGHPATVRHVHRVGHALRALHAGAVQDDGWAPKDLPTQMDATRRASEHIAVLLPDVGMRVEETLARANDAYEEVGTGTPTLVHGDLKADHVFIGGDHMSFLDFGPNGKGDPAMDVGKFLADLRWWQPPRSPIGRELRAAFLRGYADEGDDARDARRTGLWEAVLFLSIGAHRIPLWDAAWERRTRSLVDEAARALSESFDRL